MGLGECSRVGEGCCWEFSTAPSALQLAPSNSATCFPAMRSTMYNLIATQDHTSKLHEGRAVIYRGPDKYTLHEFGGKL